MKFNRDRREGIGAPGFGHDELSGFNIGSLYYDCESGVLLICRDNTANAAQWHPIAAHRPIPSKSYFGPDWVNGSADGQVSPNLLTFQPITIQERIQVDRMIVPLTTAGSAGAKARLMMYNSRYGLPLTLRKDFGEVALDGATGYREAVSGTVLDPGTYFLAALFFSVTTMPVVRRVSSSSVWGVPQFSSTGVTSGNSIRGLKMDQAYGAAPQKIATDPVDTNEGFIPILGLRRA